MRIIVWLRQKKLEGRKKGSARHLAEIRTRLRKLRTREPQMRSIVQPELLRIRELEKMLNRVKSEEKLRFWRSLFNMCVPVFEALLDVSSAQTRARRLKKDSKQ